MIKNDTLTIQLNIKVYYYCFVLSRCVFTSKVSQEFWRWKMSEHSTIPCFPSFEETATREILPRLLVVFNNIDEEDVCLDHWVVSLVCCHYFITKPPQHIWYSPLGNKGYLVTSILVSMMVDILLYIAGLLFGGRIGVAIGFSWCYRFWMLVIAGEYVFDVHHLV